MLILVLCVVVFVLVIRSIQHGKQISSVQAELWELTRTVRAMEHRLRKLGLDDSNEGEG